MLAIGTILTLLLLTSELSVSKTRKCKNLHSKQARKACLKHNIQHRVAPASDHWTQNSYSRSSPSPTEVPAGDQWSRTSNVQGQELVNFFNFETQNTGSQGGNAEYVSLEEAERLGLVQVDNNVVRLSVETTKSVQGSRKSIRMSSKSAFSAGTLIIVDVSHMPVACGAWPALWTVARDGSWPEKGEIDIIEGVNKFTKNGISVHTKAGFVMKDTGFSCNFMMEGNQKTNCDAQATNDQGCGLRDTDAVSFGEPFNAAQGGVFALDWSEGDISVHYFPRSSIPSDIRAGNPSKSSSWRLSTPRAKFQDANGQQTSSYFQEHVLVFNTNLCGAWPEGVWSAEASYAGQEQSCAQITGHDSCSSFISHAGDQLAEAYWSINSVQMYN